MVVVVFRSRLEPGIEEEIEVADARMAALAATMPGYVSYRQYAAEDGESARRAANGRVPQPGPA